MCPRVFLIIDRAKLLFTDTDSLTYEIQIQDAYEEFSADKSKFDNGEYPGNSQFFDKTNKEVIGKFKDDAYSVLITEIVGLRSKMYSYIKEDHNGNKTAKGIKKNVKKNLNTTTMKIHNLTTN